MREIGRVDDELRTQQSATFDASVKAMMYWCRLNEQLVLDRHAASARLIVGFERLSRVHPVAARYERLAEATKLTLFAVRDAKLPFETHVVDVTGGPLEREWFFAVDSPRYQALLVARDQSGFGTTGPLAGRRFVGLGTHDTQLVRLAIDALEGMT
jgi:DICT domain-containing protein